MTQREKVKVFLKRNKMITSWDAFQRFRITRLSSIILRLRKSGMHIVTDMQPTADGKSKFAVYRLILI